MSMTPIGSLVPYGGPVLRHEILANSVTFTVNDSVKFSSGFVAAGTAAASVLGHLSGISTNKGTGLQSTGAAGATFGSFVGVYLTASDNQTVAMVRGEVDISQFTLYTSTLTAAPGVTTGSNLAGYQLNLSTASVLDEASALTTILQYENWGLDPVNSAQIIVNIKKSQVFNT